MHPLRSALAELFESRSEQYKVGVRSTPTCSTPSYTRLERPRTNPTITSNTIAPITEAIQPTGSLAA